MITILICTILISKYLFEIYLEYLNANSRSLFLPKELSQKFDLNNYKKAIDYDKVNHKILNVTNTIYLIILIILVTSDGFAFLDDLVSKITTNTIFKSIVFLWIFLLAFEIINIPLNLYKTFIIEEKFGFNKITPKLFVVDKIKALFFKFFFGSIVLSCVLWFYKISPNLFWVYTWIFTSILITIVITFYSNIFVPFFNTQKLLEDGELKTTILDYFKSIGLKIENIYVLNASKRSEKVNAYFAGLGNKRRIVIYDTLINEFTTNEILAIVAHEAGHYKLNHLRKDIIVNIMYNGLLFFLFSISLNFPELYESLGVIKPSFHIGFIAFMMLFSPISFTLNVLMRKLSRKHEFEADDSAKQNSLSEYMISALIKISAKNLKNLSPHPFYVNIYYTHPTLLQRILALKK